MPESVECLKERIAAHVGATVGADVAVRALEKMPGGACQENYIVVLAVGDTEPKMVLSPGSPLSVLRRLRTTARGRARLTGRRRETPLPKSTLTDEPPALPPSTPGSVEDPARDPTSLGVPPPD